MLVFLKIFCIIPLVIVFISCSLFVELFVENPATKRNLHTYHTHLCSRVLLFILGVRIEGNALHFLSQNRASFIVANHLSYLDVFILAALKPIVFVTSKEVEESGFLGTISKSAGALFVERRKRTAVGEEIKKLSSVLAEGCNIAIFPEGTTSSGEAILPFKSTFFDAAVRNQSDVIPICINYKRVNSIEMATKWKEHLFYYGTMDFFSHFLKVLSLNSIEVSVTVAPPIPTIAPLSRKELSTLSFSKIVSHYVPVV